MGQEVLGVLQAAGSPGASRSPEPFLAGLALAQAPLAFKLCQRMVFN